MVRKNQIVQSLDDDMIEIECLHPAQQEPIIPPVVPIVSVKSVDGKTGDVVLENLTVGDKVYNGTHPVELVLNDLVPGGAAVTYRGAATAAELNARRLDIKEGEMYLAIDTNEFWYGVGVSTVKKIPTEEFLAPYAKIKETANEVKVEFSDISHAHLLSVALKNALGEVISEDAVKIPIEKLITEIKYDHATKSLIFYFEDGDFKTVPLTELVDSLMKEITKETARAKEAEETIAANLAQEIKDRTDIDTDLLSQINAEVSTRDAHDQLLVKAIEDEIKGRQEADAALDTAIKVNAKAIEGETSRAIKREDEISSDVLVETRRAIGKEDELKGQIDSHTSRLTAIEETKIPDLEQALSDEATARQTKDTALDSEIALLKVVDSGLDSRITGIEEQEAKWNAKYDKPTTGIPKADLEEAVQSSLSKADVSAKASDLSAEEDARVKKDAELFTKIESDDALVRREFKAADDGIIERVKAIEDAKFQQLINEEIETARKEEKKIADNLTAEVKRATGAETTLTTAIGDETLRAKEAEQALTANLNKEEAARILADSSLSSKITEERDARIITVNNEATARKDLDDLLAEYIRNEKKAREDADAAEATVRDAADQLLQKNINIEATIRAGAVSSEAEARLKGDDILGTRIDDEAESRAKADKDEFEARKAADSKLQDNIDAEKTRAEGIEATKANLPDKCPDWLNPTGQTPYPWFMASLDVESTGLGPDAAGNLKANVGAYNFNQKQYYKWEKNIPFAATQEKAGLMTAADKKKLDDAVIATGLQEEIDRAKARENEIEAGYLTADAGLLAQINAIHIPEYAMRKEASSEFAAVYHLTKDGVDVPVEINIPKDQILKEASIGKCVEEDNPKGFHVGEHYIKLVFETSSGLSTHYIKLEEVVKLYEGDNTTIVINDQNVISIHPDVKTKIDNTAAGLALEVEAREKGYAALVTVIGDETARAKKAEDDLQRLINEEATRAKAAEKVLTDNLDAEVVRAKAAEKVLTDDLAAEVKRATEAEAEEKARAIAAENTKVDKEISSGLGKALIFNEADGGGAKFEDLNGNASFVGVNSDTNRGIGALLYDINVAENKGTKIDITRTGAYYTKGDESAKLASDRDTEPNEIAVKKDITEASGILDAKINAEILRATEAEATKVDKEITSAIGKALIFNEADGGGAKFVHTTSGVESFVGVNDGGETGIAAQIYADKYIDGKWQGAKLDVKNTGIYYTVGNAGAAERDVDTNELAVKGDVSAEERRARGAESDLDTAIKAEETRAKGIEAIKADLPAECPDWLNPTGETPYPWFMASLDVESTGLGPDAAGNLKVNVGAYNFNQKLYYQWKKNIPFAATQSKAGLMTAADKVRLDATASKELLDTAIAKEVTDRNAAIKTAVEALDATLGVESGKIITSIVLTDGKLEKIESETLTIAKVYLLQDALDSLSGRIAALEALKLSVEDREIGE